jgi:hypothetical protein
MFQMSRREEWECEGKGDVLLVKGMLRVDFKKKGPHLIVKEVGETAKGGYRYRVGRFDTQGGGWEGLLRIVQGEWTVLDSP